MEESFRLGVFVNKVTKNMMLDLRELQITFVKMREPFKTLLCSCPPGRPFWYRCQMEAIPQWKTHNSSIRVWQNAPKKQFWSEETKTLLVGLCASSCIWGTKALLLTWPKPSLWLWVAWWLLHHVGCQVYNDRNCRIEGKICKLRRSLMTTCP